MSRRRSLATLSVALLCAVAPGAAQAVTERASLHASFSPDRLGTPTTISFAFHLETDEGIAPPPLTSLDLRIPAGMNYTDTTLGLSICQPSRVARPGPRGLSP